MADVSLLTAIATFAFFGLVHPGAAQGRGELRFAKAVLGQLQQRSFSENREFCGYIGRDADGRWRASLAYRGHQDSCDPRFPEDMTVVASFHTHGGFMEDASSEVPSVNDMEADEAEGIDGYVATPGGRLWYIDTTEMVASQLCGIGCLVQDPAFVAGADGEVYQSYSVDELIARENEG